MAWPPTNSRAIGAIVALGVCVQLATAWWRPFWMDERFTAALATTDVPRVIAFSRADVHPPTYYLAIWSWNRAGVALFGAGEASPSEKFTAYTLPGIGITGVFRLESPDGTAREVAGVYPEDWGRWPLAPLFWLRLPNALLCAAAAWLVWRMAKALRPESRAPACIAAALTMASPFMLTWMSVARGYALQTFAMAALAWAMVRFAQADLRQESTSAATSRRRRWMGELWRAAAVGALAAFAMLSGYILLLALPPLVFAALILPRANRRRLALLGGVAAGLGIAAALWGDAFFAQNGLRDIAIAENPHAAAHGAGDEFGKAAATFWGFLFSYGVSHTMNPFDNPAAYYVAFALYAICMGASVYALAVRTRKSDAIGAVFALAPVVAAATANVLRPDSIPIHARYFAPFAPYFYWWIALGGECAWRGLHATRRQK